MRRLRHWLFLAAVGLIAPYGCSLFVDLDPLSAGAGGGGAGSAGEGGAGGAGQGGAGNGGGTAGAGAMPFTDDELDEEFGAGTFDGTAWQGDRVALAPGAAEGEFFSRVFDAAAPVTWQSLSFRPLAPYSKPLPDQGAKESGYAEGNVDMTGNVLLLHLDGEGTVDVGDVLQDASGRGNDFTADGAADDVALFAPGRFGAAYQDTSTRWLAAEVGPGSDFQFDEGDFTWALWVRTTQSCAGNKVHLGVEDSGTPTDTHLWLGCAPDSDGSCPPGASGGRAAGHLTSVQGDGVEGLSFCSVKVINDGAWHHLALTKEGHSNATVRLYVDGVEEYAGAASFEKPFDLTESPQLAVGAFSGGSYQAVGEFDEVAIWLRALGASEVTALHRRGALRLALQVRTCPDAACAGAGPFAGPGQLATTWFLDPATALGPGAAQPLTGLPSAQFFQYLVRLESDIPTQSPGLAAVTVTAAP